MRPSGELSVVVCSWRPGGWTGGGFSPGTWRAAAYRAPGTAAPAAPSGTSSCLWYSVRSFSSQSYWSLSCSSCSMLFLSCSPPRPDTKNWMIKGMWLEMRVLTSCEEGRHSSHEGEGPWQPGHPDFTTAPRRAQWVHGHPLWSGQHQARDQPDSGLPPALSRTTKGLLLTEEGKTCPRKVNAWSTKLQRTGIGQSLWVGG